MLKIDRLLLPDNLISLKATNPMQPQFIVIHNTANDASAMSEISWMMKNPKSTSYHYAVDESRAVQGVPLNRNAWHAGDGTNGVGNRRGISVEICRSTSNDKELFLKAENNAAELVAMLLIQFNWGIEKVKKHQDFSGKYCPHRTLDLGWERFLKKVEIKLKELQQPTDVPDWAKEAWEWAKQKGIVDGTNPNGAVTRTMGAAMLHRMYKLPCKKEA